MSRVLTDPPAGTGERWLSEIGPTIVVVSVIWAKLIQISLLLPSVSWAGGEPLQLFAAVRAYPDMFSATLACLLLPTAFLFLVHRVARLVTLLLLDLALTMLAVADFIHVRFYADVSSIADIAQTSMLEWVVDSLLTLPQATDALYFVDIMIGALLVLPYAHWCQRVEPLGPVARARLVTGPAVAAFLFVLPTTRLASAEQTSIFGYSTIRLEVASSIGLLPYHLSDAFMNLVWGHQEPTASDLQRVSAYLDRQRRLAGPPSDLFGVAAGKNLIVLSAESTQALVIGLEVDGQPVAPNLTALARESIYLANNYEPTHLGSTSDAEFAIMNSLHPLPVGVVAARYARNQYHGLPAILADRGYSTFSAVGAVSYFWNMNQLHPRYGFQHSYFEDSFQVNERIVAWITDHDFFTQMRPILASQQEPFMGFMLSSSSHHPFAIPEKYQTLRLGKLEGTMTGNYLQAIHYFDGEFGLLLDWMRQSGLLDRSVLVVYGDHQAFLGGLPEIPPLLGFNEWDEFQHFRVVKRTPVMIRLPGAAHAGAWTTTTSHLDVAPTVLSLLGVEDRSAVMLGRDLTRTGQSLAVFRDGSFADESHYFVNRFGGPVASHCYEAATAERIDCAPFESLQRDARERLEASDMIVQGDLVPVLGGSAAATASR